MHQTKVEFGDRVWTPVTGCIADCEYCNTRRSSKRFAGDIRMNLSRTDKYTKDGNLFILDEQFISDEGHALSTPFGFEPTYHRYSARRLETLKTPMSVLVSTTGELFGDWIDDKYIKEVFDETAKYPEQRFLFQTRFPERYYKLANEGKLRQADNCWYGWTVVGGSLHHPPFEAPHKYIVLEPLLGPVEPEVPEDIEWIVIGADTGKYRGQVKPKWEWIEALVEQCYKQSIPVWMLDTIKGIVPEDQFRKEKPAVMTERKFSRTNELRFCVNCRVCGVRGQKGKSICVTFKHGRKGRLTIVGYLCTECAKNMCKDYNLDDLEE